MHESTRYVEHLFDTSIPGITVLALLLGLVGLAVAANSYVRSSEFRPNPVAWLKKSTTLLWVLPVLFAFALVGSRLGFQTHDSSRPNPPAPDTTPISHVPGPPEVPAEPAWVREDVVELPGLRLVTVHGPPRATIEEAEERALAESAGLVREAIVRADPRLADAPAPVDAVRRVAVRAKYVEPVVHHTENFEFQMYRAHNQVELSDDVVRDLLPTWSRSVALDRLWTLGTIVGFLSLTFGVFAGYLRLDELAAGRHRGRLRFAAASMVTALGLIAAVLL